MPFTISHVAAVLPFHRPLSRLRLFTAAVIGSMVPDFGLLSPLQVNRLETHSVAALVTFCLPVGLLSYWLTQVLIRPAVRQVVPDGAYARLPPDDSNRLLWNWRHWLLVMLVILAGAVTHLAWDLFTHEDSRGTRWFPVLNEAGPEVNGHIVRLTRWLQYGSSLFGLLAVLIAFGLWWWHTRATKPSALSASRRLSLGERWAWLSGYLLVPLARMARDVLHGVPSNIGEFLRNVAIHGMRWTIVGLLLVSALIRLRLATRAR